MKVHIRDIRLYNNAGISFPACQAGAKLLDLDKSCWTTRGAEDATCINCKRIYRKRYPWSRVRTLLGI
jgi:hypothetical protein